MTIALFHLECQERIRFSYIMVCCAFRAIVNLLCSLQMLFMGEAFLYHHERILLG